MKDTIKVSVIIPVYNGERYLRECLDSVASQTLKDIEVICVDDGSVDSTPGILDEYALNYANFNVYHIKNRGTWRARAFGLSHANGEYISFCDSDDMMRPDMLEKMYEGAVSSNSEMVICGFRRCRKEPKDGNLISAPGTAESVSFGSKVIEMSNHIEMFAYINPSFWNKIIRKDVMEKHISLDTPPRFAEDVVIMASIYPFIKKICFTDDILYFYRYYRGMSISYFKKEDMPALLKSMEQLFSGLFDADSVCSDYISDLSSADIRKKWMAIYDLFVLLHPGLSAILRSRREDAGELIDEVQAFLNKMDPEWKKNENLSMFSSFVPLKFRAAAMLHKTGLIRFVAHHSKFFEHFIKW